MNYVKNMSLLDFIYFLIGKPEWVDQSFGEAVECYAETASRVSCEVDDADMWGLCDTGFIEALKPGHRWFEVELLELIGAILGEG